ncbi:MAG: 16S rRNA (adenine(1518)-N(6)/adenine(1519)-N(6))-dimethyltransferase RsmA [Thermoanaerobaculia bacterium]|nr:16S rRNA (adenine(1518)-N(6)/adenine(1519)-N(6))-dimethyltransferase RsmA [Thermoanaerobaculia bacterium]
MTFAPRAGQNPRLKKKLGQHHLIRSESCRPLVEFLNPSGERVLEIGPGGGVLTQALVDSGARVLAVELDLEWAAVVHARFTGEVPIATVDALTLDFSRLPVPTMVAGNLPYNVGTAILTRVLPHHSRVPRAAFLVQLEVAQRLTARPSTRGYGSLSVFAQVYSRARILGRVKPGSFRPPPRVDSAFVGFELTPPPLPEAELGAFETLVRQGFAHKRKTLRNSLALGLGREAAEALLSESGFSTNCRAEEMALSEWLVLHSAWQGLASEMQKC